MAVDEFAQQIKTSVDKRVRDARAAGKERRRSDVEAEVTKEALYQIRCYELWAKDGGKEDIEVTAYLNQAVRKKRAGDTVSASLIGRARNSESIGKSALRALASVIRNPFRLTPPDLAAGRRRSG